MNALPVVGRIVWKEFYALRMVWIACVLGVLGLSATVTMSAAAFEWRGYAGVFWGLAMVVPAAYVVACCAMTFAGEKEDRTSDWLVVLAPPQAPLYFTKQAFVLVSGLAMQVFLAASAACFTLLDRDLHGFSLVGNMPQNAVWDTIGVAEFVFLECLVWGTFWSLQTGKAANAIFKTIATLITIFMVAGFTLDWSRMHAGSRFWASGFETFGWLRTSWTVAVFAASWVLGQRWLAGRGIEWETILAQWFHRRLPRTRVVARDRAEPWQRAWQRLWWLEVQSLKTFGAMTVVAAALSGISILLGQRPTLTWMMSFNFLLILIGGLLSWRGEQTRHQYRLLVNYGIAPAALWLNKLILWFAATFAAVAAVAAVTLAEWEFLAASYPEHTIPIYGPKWMPLRTMLDNAFIEFPERFWLLLFVAGCYAVMTFAAAFLWSLLCRKAVIAFGLTLVMLCLLGPWYGLAGAIGLPLWWSLAPLPVWLLAISYRHLTAWWLEQDGWRVWALRAVELAIVPAALGLGAIAYRVYSIPAIPEEETYLSSKQLRGGFRDDFAPNDAAWGRVYTAMEGLLPLWGIAAEPIPPVAVSAIAPANTPDNLTPLDHWLTERHESLLELRTALQATQGLVPPANSDDWNAARISAKLSLAGTAVSALIRQAQLSLAAGQTEQSVQWLQAAVRLAGETHCRLPFNPYMPSMLSGENWLFEQMAAWAQHPAQSEATLKAGLGVCTAELKLWQTSFDQLRDFEEPPSSRRPEDRDWFWEEARKERLAQVGRINRATYLMNVRVGMQPASMQPPQPFGMPGPIRRAWYVDPEPYSPSPWGHRPVVGLDHPSIDRLHDVETRYRAAVTTMGIVGFRKLHGRLPTSLAEVAPLFGERRWVPTEDPMRDPWSWAWFHYEPDGFPLLPDETPARLRGPVLWSVGKYHYAAQVTPRGIEFRSTIPGLHVSYQLREGADHGVMIVPIPPPTAETE